VKRLLAILAAVSLVAPACAKNEQTTKAASLTPPDALAYVSVSLDPPAGQKRNLQGICARFKDLGKDDCDVQRILVELFEDIGLDYNRDVKPWIGKELAFAVLPPGEAGGDPLTVLFVEAGDTAAASDRLRAAARSGDLDAGYKVVGNFVVLDGQEKKSDRTAALARVQAQAGEDAGKGPQKALAGNAGFTSVVSKVRSPRLALGWLNAKETLKLLGTHFPIPGFGALLDEAERKGAGGSVAFALYAETGVLALEGVTDGKGATQELAGTPKLTEGLPADTLAAVTAFGVGKSLSAGLGAAEGAAGAGPQMSGFLDEMRRETGLDLQQDVFSWMKGEVVISAGRLREGRIPDIGLVVEPTDEARAAAGVTKLRTAAEKSLGAPLRSRAIGQTTAYVVPEPFFPGVQPAMALFSDRFVLASTPEYLTTLSKPSTPGFGATAEYRQVIGSNDAVAFQILMRLAAVRDAVVSVLDPEEKAAYQSDVVSWVQPLETLLLRVLPSDGPRIEIKVTTR
jgi:uncharacterized protein DUF3352